MKYQLYLTKGRILHTKPQNKGLPGVTKNNHRSNCIIRDFIVRC